MMQEIWKKRKMFFTLSSVAGLFFGRFLGSEGTAIMNTGLNLVIFAIFLFGFSFMFRLYCVRLLKKYNFRVVFFLYLSILFVISFYFYFLRIYLVSRFGLLVADLFSLSSVLILSVGAGQALSLPGPSSPSHSSSFQENSFDIGVFLEPFSDTESEGTSANPPIRHNHSVEASLQNRILTLKNQNSIFLLGKNETYWTEIKGNLDRASSQLDYNILLEFENRDLQIREQKHSCYSLYQQVLSGNPALGESVASTEEAFVDFFDEKRKELETHHPFPQGDPEVKDRMELAFLRTVSHDLRNQGPNSHYIRKIFNP